MPLLGLSQQGAGNNSHQDTPSTSDDSLIWSTAISFGTYFNKSDTTTLSALLPEDFILQWMHENFVGKNNFIKTMLDSAVHVSLKHKIDRNETAILRYSDDHTAASLNTSFEFTDPAIANSVRQKHGYGLCIIYLQKIKGIWKIKTVHLDIHCSLCNI